MDRMRLEKREETQERRDQSRGSEIKRVRMSRSVSSGKSEKPSVVMVARGVVTIVDGDKRGCGMELGFE